MIGITEITSRYRDEPDNALATIPSVFYLLVNAAASILALVSVRFFGWNFGIVDETVAHWIQVLVAGFGAMALLRTSIFTVQVGEQVVPYGPSRFLEALMSSVDRAVDRKRARERAVTVSEIMKDVSFDKAYQALPAYCFGLLQNLAQDEQDKFAKKIVLLVNAEMNLRVKSLLLGLSLMNLVGEKVLETAVKNLGDDIRSNPGPSSPPPD